MRLLLGLQTLFNTSCLTMAAIRYGSIPRVVLPFDHGTIIGTSTSFPSPTSAIVDKYLGIPYAKSPPERFAPPRITGPLGTIQAQDFKATCIQQFNYPKLFRDRLTGFTNNPPLTESEDCLYINVFTPRRAQSLPVMFWIYGGTFQSGGSQLAFYDAALFAVEQNVVLVTFNYRTGPFGFSNSPEIPSGLQNSGFLDQRLALSWVQRNIAAFGGDPTKVTIFGESAGAASVKQLVLRPPKPIPFTAAIIQSDPLTPSSNQFAYETLVAQSNCTTATSPLACLRALPASTIKNISEVNSLYFWPELDNQTNSLIPTTKFQPSVPVLIGSNADEGTLFAWFFGFDTPGLDARTALNLQFGGNDQLIEGLLSDYREFANDTFAFMSKIQTDLTFVCSLSQLSNLTANTKVWRYLYTASFKNLEVFNGSKAYHGSEVPIVFGTYPKENATRAELKTSKYVQSTWARFARHPNSGPGWHKIGSQRDVQVIGSNGNDVTPKSAPRARFDNLTRLKTICEFALNT